MTVIRPAELSRRRPTGWRVDAVDVSYKKAAQPTGEAVVRLPEKEKGIRIISSVL